MKIKYMIEARDKIQKENEDIQVAIFAMRGTKINTAFDPNEVEKDKRKPVQLLLVEWRKNKDIIYAIEDHDVPDFKYALALTGLV